MPTPFSFTYVEPVLLEYFKKTIEKNSAIVFDAQTIDIGFVFLTLFKKIITTNIFSYFTETDRASFSAFIKQLDIKDESEKKDEKSPVFTLKNNEQIKKFLSFFIYIHNQTLILTKEKVVCEETEIDYIRSTHKITMTMMFIKKHLEASLYARELNKEYCAFMTLILNNIKSIANNISRAIYTNHFTKPYPFLLKIFEEISDTYKNINRSIFFEMEPFEDQETLLTRITSCEVSMIFYQAQYHALKGEDNNLEKLLEQQHVLHANIEKNKTKKKNLFLLSNKILSEHKAFNIEIQQDSQRAALLELLSIIKTHPTAYYACTNTAKNIKMFKKNIIDMFNSVSEITEVNKDNVKKLQACISFLELMNQNHYFNSEDIIIYSKKIIIKIKIILANNKQKLLSKIVEEYLEIYSKNIKCQESLLDTKKNTNPIKKKTKNNKHNTVAQPQPIKLNPQEELKKIQDEIAKHEEEIKILITKNSTLQIKQEEMNQENEKLLQNELEKEKYLQEAIDSLTSKLSNSTQEAANSTQELTCLQEENAVLKSKNSTYKNELNKIKGSIKKLKTECSALEKCNTLLKNPPSIIVSNQTAFEKTQENNKEQIENLIQAKILFIQNNKAYEQQVQETRTLLQAEKGSAKSLKNEIKELIQKTQTEVESLKSEIENLEKTIKEYQEKNAQLYHEYLSTQTKLKQIKQDKQKIDQTNRQLYRNKLNSVHNFHRQYLIEIADLELLRIKNTLSIGAPIPDFLPFYGLQTYPIAPNIVSSSPSDSTPASEAPPTTIKPIPIEEYRYPQHKNSN